MSKVRFRIRVEKRLKSAMEIAAAADGVSVNALVTGMMRGLVKQHASLLTRDHVYRSAKKTGFRRIKG